MPSKKTGSRTAASKASTKSAKASATKETTKEIPASSAAVSVTVKSSKSIAQVQSLLDILKRRYLSGKINGTAYYGAARSLESQIKDLKEKQPEASEVKTS